MAGASYSVVIPVRNAERTLPSALAALAAQEPDPGEVSGGTQPLFE